VAVVVESLDLGEAGCRRRIARESLLALSKIIGTTN
jgi:hypothetical protein